MRLGQYAFCLAALGEAALSAPAENIFAACSANKKIDDFASFSNNTNSLGAVNGDDKSMASIAATGGTLTITPKAGSYFYENFPCENASGDGYNAVSFTVSGPAGSSMMLEMQSKKSCSDTAVTRSFYNVTVPAAAGAVTAPFSAFNGSNLQAITSFTWSTFTKQASPYTLGNIQFVCGK